MQVITMPVGYLGTNCYILAGDEGHCAVIDPGANPEKIARLLKDQALEPQAILLTHAHYDHIGAVDELMRLYPDINLYVPEKDANGITRAATLSRDIFVSDENAQSAVQVRDGDKIQIGGLEISVIHTPGHTVGGCCYLCEQELFTGDTLFYMDCGRVDLPGGDYGQMLASLKKLAALSGDPAVYPGHGESSTLDFERRNNRYMREATGQKP